MTVAGKPQYKPQDKKEQPEKNESSVAFEDPAFVLSWFPQETDLEIG